MSIIRLQNLLNSGGEDGLGTLVRRAREMDSLTDVLKSGLNPEFRPHLVAANLRGDGMLVAVVDSSVWAARFRYETDRLLRLARADGKDVRVCRIVVAKVVGGSVLTGSSKTPSPAGPGDPPD